ncbi:MAG: hypothetical protein ACXW3Z_10930, partial [Limisphaerales bacterium]
VEHVLSSTKSAEELDAELRQRDTSLRCSVREIFPVFGSFWADSNCDLTCVREHSLRYHSQ